MTDYCNCTCHNRLQKQPERTRYFGSPLATVVDEGGVPVFVRKCVELIEKEGIKTEGIYRVPGKKEHVLLLQDKFEDGKKLRIYRILGLSIFSRDILYFANFADCGAINSQNGQRA